MLGLISPDPFEIAEERSFTGCMQHGGRIAEWRMVTRSIFCVRAVEEAQLMLTNPRDALRGQLRSSNMVPFDVLGME